MAARKSLRQPDVELTRIHKELALSHSPEWRPLAEKNFVLVARHGFGDPANAYAHCLAWFNGHLYAGIARYCYVALRPYNLDQEYQVFPVKLPEFQWDLDWRAQIWRYDPRNCIWENIYRSPMIMGNKGIEVPLHLGFRDMEVFQGESDPAPALYTVSWGSHMGRGPFVLRCLDGRHFEEVAVSERQYFGSQTLRALKAFNGRLYTLPTGRDSGIDGTHASQQAVVLESSDPLKGGWKPVSIPHFGDPQNVMLADMETFNGHLYVGTMNPYEGYQIWKTDARGAPPYQWQRVVTQGAYRGKMNEVAGSFCVFNGSLYVGGAIFAGGYDRIYNIGPGAPEVIRLHPDDSWDLIVGEPRITPQGLKLPLSGLGPGFNNPFTGYIWRLCVHDGWLYVGTMVWSPFLRFAAQDRWAEKLKKLMASIDINRLLEIYGGFDLWRSRDGLNWTPVTCSGFGNPYNTGIRSMVSTPHGLFVCAVNVFGPEVAVKRVAGWKYEPNPRGGLEIWLGTHDPPNQEIAIVSLGGTGAGLSAVASIRPTPELTDEPCQALLQEFYGQSAWRHVGFWQPHLKTPREACENLMEELLAFTRPTAQFKVRPIPTETEIEQQIRKKSLKSHGGMVLEDTARKLILDVGCSAGASTRYLLRYFSQEQVVGLVNSKAAKRLCEANVPGVRFGLPRFSRFRFPKDTFHLVVSVEGIDGENRRRVFQEIQRVLKPGGQLVCSLLIQRDPSNGMRSTLDYERFLKTIGFQEVKVVDATQNCLMPFREHYLKFLDMKILSGKIREELKRDFLARIPGGEGQPHGYFLIWAVKAEELYKTISEENHIGTRYDSKCFSDGNNKDNITD
jgi:SAM-dependent methyltransferase